MGNTLIFKPVFYSSTQCFSIFQLVLDLQLRNLKVLDASVSCCQNNLLNTLPTKYRLTKLTSDWYVLQSVQQLKSQIFSSRKGENTANGRVRLWFVKWTQTQLQIDANGVGCLHGGNKQTTVCWKDCHQLKRWQYVTVVSFLLLPVGISHKVTLIWCFAPAQM